MTRYSTILASILDEKRREVSELKPRLPELEQRAKVASSPRSFSASLRRARSPAVVAEFKRASPSSGWIREHGDPQATAREYEASGAAALSVLTDQKFFRGSLADLSLARGATVLPVMRKDFLIDTRQIVEARAAGADAVLLIVAALSGAQLGELMSTAASFGMQSLIEVHDEAEAVIAVDAGAEIIGVNQRDLRTFTFDRTLLCRLRPLIPSDRLLIAESGIRNRDDVRTVVTAGADAILVGETLMRSASPGASLKELLS